MRSKNQLVGSRADVTLLNAKAHSVKCTLSIKAILTSANLATYPMGESMLSLAFATTRNMYCGVPGLRGVVTGKP